MLSVRRRGRSWTSQATKGRAGDGAIDDVVVVERQAVGFGAVVIDEVRPLLGVFLETLAAELLEERLVELIDVDDGGGLLELGTVLRHLQGLLTVGREIEGAPEVLVGLGLGEVDAPDVDGGAVVEFHSVPPFLWQ